MEIRILDFSLGLAVGVGLGVGLIWLVSRVRTWLGRSEVGRLTSEPSGRDNRQPAHGPRWRSGYQFI